MTTGRTRVNAKKLTDFAVEALQKVGVPKDDAQVTANILMVAEKRGVITHGIVYLARNIAKIKDGLINPKPQVKISSKTSSTAAVDGDEGLGFVVGYRAMAEAIRRAKETGAGFVTVRNSNHFGASAPYAIMALEHDMIGISMTSTGAGVVAPGSAKPAVGTNPFSWAIPAGKKPPFVLDMATSVVAAGKIGVAIRDGKSIPEGWVIDGEGKPVTDPNKRVRGEGGLLPLGGSPTLGAYKGFALGILVDILSSLLSGSPADLLRKFTPQTKGMAGNHFFGALRIDSFLPLENFKKLMDEMIEAVEALPPLPGVKKIYVAGGFEAEIVKDCETNGIPMNAKVVETLQELAKELGIEYNL